MSFKIPFLSTFCLGRPQFKKNKNKTKQTKNQKRNTHKKTHGVEFKKKIHPFTARYFMKATTSGQTCNYKGMKEQLFITLSSNPNSPVLVKQGNKQLATKTVKIQKMHVQNKKQTNINEKNKETLQIISYAKKANCNKTAQKLRLQCYIIINVHVWAI
jgi:hypothetical protein